MTRGVSSTRISPLYSFARNVRNEKERIWPRHWWQYCHLLHFTSMWRTLVQLLTSVRDMWCRGFAVARTWELKNVISTEWHLRHCQLSLDSRICTEEKREYFADLWKKRDLLSASKWKRKIDSNTVSLLSQESKNDTTELTALEARS